MNQVRAAQSLSLTQSALSRQIKSLEDHLGVLLFERTSKGLCFTQEGELLYDFTKRSFSLLNEGLGRLVLNVERQTLVVSAARSFAERVLSARVGDFVELHPWIDVHIDVHRYFSDMDSSGADISIRLGDGNWDDHLQVRLTDDFLIPVCAPDRASFLANRSPGDILGCIFYINQERDYLERWNKENPNEAISGFNSILKFNDSSTLLAAVESGSGVAITRYSLVKNAIEQGRLVRLWHGSAHDHLNYYALCSHRTAHRRSTTLFLDWLGSVFDVDQ
ncbi:hypothetical protein W822_09275 [Advenella kashmirensis W13003]|uniref:HTH lysR-type domain-containing protein n=1 Tax=Advenella kashmirensis W13003 TaxID=1424334 RepID=V8QV20_9BURK|nr:hypothetical protein W822_09275 [Advenella kashmirensis W13003]